jgi:hypothetical protein
VRRLARRFADSSRRWAPTIPRDPLRDISSTSLFLPVLRPSTLGKSPRRPRRFGREAPTKQRHSPVSRVPLPWPRWAALARCSRRAPLLAHRMRRPAQTRRSTWKSKRLPSIGICVAARGSSTRKERISAWYWVDPPRYKSATPPSAVPRSPNESAPLPRVEPALKIHVSAVQFRPRTLEKQAAFASGGQRDALTGTSAAPWIRSAPLAT